MTSKILKSLCVSH